MEPIQRDNVVDIRAANSVCRRTIERSKVLNPKYNIDRDQPIAGASPLRINTLSYSEVRNWGDSKLEALVRINNASFVQGHIR